MKKKVDARVRALIEDSVRDHHRGLFVIVGDKGKDQVVNLHYMLSKAAVKARPSVLWCYKTELGFSSHRQKRMKQIKKMMQRGLLDPEKDDPFELFISSTKIRFTFYSESEKVLGTTFGMCVLQDFEALTPNLLARTVETVEGGGLVIILLRTMSSLRSLYTMAMDAHSKLRTEKHSKVSGRFNERFILSLASCKSCIVCDDELNLLPISSTVRSKMSNVPNYSQGSAEEKELDELKVSMSDVDYVGELLARTKTIDQAKAFLSFVEAISEKTLRTTVSLTASRGRGKSAALGLAVAAAIAHEYSNIFITSPSPENLRTFFEFLFIGFDALEYQEHTDYEILQSLNPAMNKCVVRVNVFRSHRQTVQYVDPHDAAKAAQHAELFVIDEAAAIPLPIVKSLLGSYLVFMSSTITGYEGTGRSLSLKLLTQLRKSSGQGRELREVTMETPIRYSPGDPVERWLYDLLCLDAGEKDYALGHAAAHPSKCELYWIDRDALFSRHSAAEAFLRRVMALFVSSHYKNSPNDLMMLSDAPAHELFVLLGPTKADSTRLPDILCAIQVCFEGGISKESALKSMNRGSRPHGDLIPWTLSQQFQEPELIEFTGLRVIRIATNPSVQSMGYGTRAMELLFEYYSNPKRMNGGGAEEQAKDTDANEDEEADDLLQDKISPRADIPPLLRRLDERRAEELDYLGVSFGLTQQLYSFWSKQRFKPLYIRLTSNDVTGEHTTIMVVETKDKALFEGFRNDFRRRFSSLLGYEFRGLLPGLALTILEDNPPTVSRTLTRDQIREKLSVYDMRRLESYGRNLVDHHIVVDILPSLSSMFFDGFFGDVHLSLAQRAILMALGLQRKTVDVLEKELNLPANQLLALFNKVVRKLSNELRRVEEGAVKAELLSAEDQAGEKVQLQAPVEKTLMEDLEESAQNEPRESTNPALAKYEVAGSDKEWAKTLSNVKDVGSVSIQANASSRKKKTSGPRTPAKKSKKRK
mmetsp:Transcript_34138/g.133625  ORF Transcript_34138/g.133625 Transcript_34138/m.133625 type:complete len:985 (-) Transcript_34138:2661-5615(-)